MSSGRRLLDNETFARAGGTSPVGCFGIIAFVCFRGISCCRHGQCGIDVVCWRIAKRVAEEVLGKERAAYGRQIVVSLSRQLVEEHGSSLGEKNLRRMIQFAEVFPDEEIVASLIRQLRWTHFIALLPLKNPLQRDSYAR